MKQLLYFILLLICVPVNAVTVDCKPGELKHIMENQTGVSDLTVNGAMDVTDFDFISESMPELKTLVINADIVAYKGQPTRSGSGFSPANTLPEFALFGSGVTDLTLAGSAFIFGEAALAGSQVKKVVVKSTVREIPQFFARDAVNLETVELPEAVVTVDNSAFTGCSALRTVTAPGVKTVEDNAFRGCGSLSEMSFSPALESIGEYAFAASGLETVDLSGYENVKRIGAGAFSECKNLKSLRLPEGLVIMTDGLMLADSSLAEVQLPGSLQTIGDYAMAGLTALNVNESELTESSVLGSTSVEIIGKYGVANWEKAQAVILPASLEYMDDNAMQKWSSLQSITLHDNTPAVAELGENVWADTPQETASVKTSSPVLAEVLKVTPQWKEFKIVDTSGVENIIDDSDSPFVLKIWFNGSDMTLESSEEMSSVEIFDLTGRVLFMGNPGSTLTTVATSAWSGNTFLLRVTTIENNIIAKKICK